MRAGLSLDLNLQEFQDYVNVVFAPYLWFTVEESKADFTAFSSKIIVVRNHQGWKIKDAEEEEKTREEIYWLTLSRAVDHFFEQKGWVVKDLDGRYPDWDKLLS